MRKRLLSWANTPIIVPRGALTFKYILFAILGFLSAISGVETLNLLTFDGYTTVWSSALVVFSSLAGVGTFREEWEGNLEKWSCAVVAALLLTWSVAAVIRAAVEGDVGRVAGSFTVLIVSVLPSARALSLFRRVDV